MPETKASREIKELTLLFEISTKLSETLDLKTTLQPILQMTTEYLGITSEHPANSKPKKRGDRY